MTNTESSGEQQDLAWGSDRNACDVCGMLDPGDGVDPFYTIEGKYYCIDCATELAESMEDEAREYALTHCKLTRKPERYNLKYHYACTPDDYSAGMKFSYTENSVDAYNRHECTNYDKVIQGMWGGDPVTEVFLEAVRERIEELIEGALPDDQQDDQQPSYEP